MISRRRKTQIAGQIFGVLLVWICWYSYSKSRIYAASSERQSLVAFIGTMSQFGLVNPIDQEPSPSKWTDADRTVINRSNDPVWFDSSEGTVQPIAKSKSINVDDRHDSIAGPPSKTTPGWWSAFWKNLGSVFSWLFDAWPALLLLCLGSFFVLAGYILYRYVLEPEYKNKSIVIRVQSEREKAKLLDLPFEVEPSMLGLFAQAERYRAAGDYSKAIVYLFSYALVEMDSARCIHLARGKTNRAYLRELIGRDGLRDFTHQLVQAFEYAFFGKHVLTEETFERIWEQVPMFEATIKQSQSPPSSLDKLAKARSA